MEAAFQEDVEQLAEKLVRFEENPKNWGDEGAQGSLVGLFQGPWGSNVPFQVWEWAEKNHRQDVKSKIARSIAREVVVYRQNQWDAWFNKLELEARDALSKNDLEKYACFQEGVLILGGIRRSKERIENILVLYRLLGKKEKVVYYLNEKAMGMLSIFSSKKDKNMAWRLWVEAYYISKEIDFPKGVFFAVFGLGTYLSRIKADHMAVLFFYNAKLLAQEIQTPYGITARDELRRVARRSNIEDSFYSKVMDSEELIRKFLDLVLCKKI